MRVNNHTLTHTYTHTHIHTYTHTHTHTHIHTHTHTHTLSDLFQKIQYKYKHIKSNLMVTYTYRKAHTTYKTLTKKIHKKFFL